MRACGERADRRRKASCPCDWPGPSPYQGCSPPKVIVEMKRQQTSFWVEIKKSRTQGQRQQLPWRRRAFCGRDPQVLQDEAVPEVAAPTTAPRILPSIVEPTWSRSVPAESVPFTLSPGETTREPMEFDLGPAVSGAENDIPAETPIDAEAALPCATAAPVGTGTTPTPDDAQPVSGPRAKSHARTTRTKARATVAAAQAPEPAPDAEPTPHAALIAPSMKVPLRSNQRRLTKRRAAAGQLPRSERWKRRLHPASW